MADQEGIRSRMEELADIIHFGKDEKALSLLTQAMDSGRIKEDSQDGTTTTMRDTRLAMMGDALLGFFTIEWLLECEVPNSQMDKQKQGIVRDYTQHHLLKQCGMEKYYHNHGIFLGEDDANKPSTSPDHIPYLEAIIGAMYLLDGMEKCRGWVIGTVIPQLSLLSPPPDPTNSTAASGEGA